MLPHSSVDDSPLYPVPVELSAAPTSGRRDHPLPWLPLVSKAYFKVHGGYSMRGSNPAPDIYEMTGWIPERLDLNDAFQREKEWERLYEGWKTGIVLVTLGTGDRPGNGLISLHAYAVLGMSYEIGIVGPRTDIYSYATCERGANVGDL